MLSIGKNPTDLAVHAGEGRPPSEIREAVLLLHAQRIGHGTTLPDDPAVVELVRERSVTIEACLTSNLHTGAVTDLAAHPLPRLLGDGVTVQYRNDGGDIRGAQARVVDFDTAANNDLLAVNQFFGDNPYKGIGLFRDRDEVNLQVRYQF